MVSFQSLYAKFLFLLLLRLTFSSQGAQTCDADGICTIPEGAKCGLDKSFCQSTSSSVYQHGGTAQAYKSEASIKNEICSEKEYLSSEHRVATWPFWRSSKKSPPKLLLRINLQSCFDAAGSTCCCHPLIKSENSTNVAIEAWQTRPDGTYSSLRKGEQEGDCRARMFLAVNESSVAFETVAPGSYGSLGGLGPSKWDFVPYGIPVIHIMVSAAGHAQTLIDLPVLMNRKTLEARTFSGPDWRGSSWVREKQDELPYNFTAWKPDSESNQVEIEVDIFLKTEPDESSTSDIPSSSKLCQSQLYGLPYSFFLEPISECAPSMLDFFAL